jgi:hypothetical protein
MKNKRQMDVKEKRKRVEQGKGGKEGEERRVRRRTIKERKGEGNTMKVNKAE